MRQGIVKEIELIKSMQHKNIIRYIDSLECDNILYIVLEFAEKGSLDKLRKLNEFDEPTISCFIGQVL